MVTSRHYLFLFPVVYLILYIIISNCPLILQWKTAMLKRKELVIIGKRIRTHSSSQNDLFNFNLSLSRNVGDIFRKNHKPHWKQAVKEIAKDLKAKKMEFKCTNQTWRGNWIDCNTFPFVVKKPCLVYSFGINYEFDPDDAFASLGCDVFSFDPSMGETKEHIRKSGVHFYPIGLAGVSKRNFSPRIDMFTKKKPSQKWTIKTLQDIIISLGHENRHLDYLKMDIEYYEWDAIDSILRDKLSSRIKQLGLEFHIFPDTPKENIVRYLQTYKMLKDSGFRRFDGNLFEFNINEKTKRMQADCEFVNLRFDFKKYQVVY